jgi:hypothetical protein
LFGIVGLPRLFEGGGEMKDLKIIPCSCLLGFITAALP